MIPKRMEKEGKRRRAWVPGSGWPNFFVTIKFFFVPVGRAGFHGPARPSFYLYSFQFSNPLQVLGFPVWPARAFFLSLYKMLKVQSKSSLEFPLPCFLRSKTDRNSRDEVVSSIKDSLRASSDNITSIQVSCNLSFLNAYGRSLRRYWGHFGF